MASVEDRDLGWANIQKKLKVLNSLEVSVGVQGSEAKAKKKTSNVGGGSTTRGDAPDLVTIATVHEFGNESLNIPQRSYIRSTIDAEARNIARMQRATVEAALDPKSNVKAVERAAKTLGLYLQGKIRTKIVQIQSPPLSQATKQRKAATLYGGKKRSFIGGSGNPLVDTGQLKSSITFRVRTKGKIL